MIAGWPHINILAKPRVPPGSSELLDRAIASGARDADALDAIERWSAASGGLPGLDSLEVGGVRPLFMITLSAFERATDVRGLEAIGYLGHRLVAEGAMGLIDGTEGINWMQKVFSKANDLGLTVAIPPLPPFVRILAAEATFAHRTRTALANGAVGVLMGSRPDLDSVLSFWETALGGADADESSAVTIERMHRAAPTDMYRNMVGMIEGTSKRFELIAANARSRDSRGQPDA